MQAESKQSMNNKIELDFEEVPSEHDTILEIKDDLLDISDLNIRANKDEEM